MGGWRSEGWGMMLKGLLRDEVTWDGSPKRFFSWFDHFGLVRVGMALEQGCI